MQLHELRKGRRVAYNGNRRSWLKDYPKAVIKEVSTFNNSALVEFFDSRGDVQAAEWIGGGALNPASEHEELLVQIRAKRDEAKKAYENLEAAVAALEAL